MIPRAYITAWRAHAPWVNDSQVEQDLILSRSLIELFSHPLIAENLILRGGTAQHKLYITPALRYSEDIDLVQKAAGPIGNIINVMRDKLGSWLGEPQRSQSQGRVTLVYRFTSSIPPITKLRLKLEINTREHFSVLGLERKFFKVDNPWFQSGADVVTYQMDELIATKLRALYQRKKGRDLFDLWIAVQHNLVNPVRVVECFGKYMEAEGHQISKSDFEANLSNKLKDLGFMEDIHPLLASDISYDAQQAGAMIHELFLPHLPK